MKTNSSPLSILMLSASFHPYIGGAEKQALELSQALMEKGLQVTVLTRRLPRTARRESVGGVAVRRLSAPASRHGLPSWLQAINSIGFMAACAAYLFRHRRRYDVIHVNLGGSPAVAAAWMGRRLGKGVVVKLGGGRGVGELTFAHKSFLGRLKLAAFRRLRPRFLAVTRDMMQELADVGLADCPVHFLPNGINTRTYRPPMLKEKIAARQKMGWGPEPAFLYVGRLSAEKRLAEFMEDWASAVGQAGLPAQFHMVGSGPEESRLKEKIRSLGLEGRASVRAATSDILPYYHAADIFVLPSVSEGLSNALLESMACGLTVLASRVGGAKENLREGHTGLLFDPADRGEAVEKILLALRRPDLAARLGNNARKFAAMEFSMDKIAGEVIKIYESERGSDRVGK